MLPLYLIMFALLFINNTSCALANDTADSNFAKNIWVIYNVFCPVGCPERVIEFMKNQIGKTVKFSNNQLESPFLDHCDGVVHYEFKKYAVGDIVNDINKSIGKKK